MIIDHDHSKFGYSLAILRSFKVELMSMAVKVNVQCGG